MARASEKPGTLAVAVDAAVVRPACFVATVLGAALFAVTLPVAATSKSIKQTADALVVKPAQATFTRPLGDLESLELEGQGVETHAGEAK